MDFNQFSKQLHTVMYGLRNDDIMKIQKRGKEISSSHTTVYSKTINLSCYAHNENIIDKKQHHLENPSST